MWLANLACIELHQTHYRSPNYEHPDYFVFDLDPPDDYPFTDVIGLALELREHLEAFGYHPFVKTTGRKGLHILVPIEPVFDFESIYEAAQVLAKSFVAARAGKTTLHIKKDSRKGRVLVDIYRNRRFQTIVAPYSVRGLPGAPVSTPLAWDQLESFERPSDLNIHTVSDMVIADGDPWEAMSAYAVELHTRRAPKKTRAKSVRKSTKYKTPDQLATYADKRRFEKTPEPSPGDLDLTGQQIRALEDLRKILGTGGYKNG